MSTKHIAKPCMIAGCKQEAERWIECAGVEGGTFYLCLDHALEISPNDDVIKWIDVGERIIEEEELGVYACSETCEVCN